MYHFINDNFHTDIATVPPSYKMKHFHEHNRWELMFIYSGSCTLYVGDEIYMLNPGGLALISPDTAHMTTCHLLVPDMSCHKSSGCAIF